MSAEESLAEVLAAEVVEALRKTWRGDYSAQMIADIAARALLASPVLQGLREEWVREALFDAPIATVTRSIDQPAVCSVVQRGVTTFQGRDYSADLNYRRTEPTT